MKSQHGFFELFAIVHYKSSDSRSKCNVCVTFTGRSIYSIIQSNLRLNAVKNLQSKLAIKTINSCIDKPLNLLTSWVFFNIRTRYTLRHPISPLNSRNPCWTVDGVYIISGSHQTCRKSFSFMAPQLIIDLKRWRTKTP